MEHFTNTYNVQSIVLDGKQRKKFADVIKENSPKYILASSVDDFIFFTARAVDVGDYYGVLGEKSWEHCVNANGDYFDYTEVTDIHPVKRIPRYKTFANRGFFRNHESDRIENSIGFVFDSVLNVIDKNTIIISCLVGVDKQKAPDVARTLMTYPEKQGVSMGCSIQNSICTNCGHDTINNTKCGCLTKYHNRRHPDTGVLVAEMVKGVDFFELSGVTNPAFAFSYVLDIVRDWVPGTILRVAEKSPNDSKLRNLVSLFAYIRKRLGSADREEKLHLNSKLDEIIMELGKLGVKV
ncbi:MAG: hypothetical protein ABIK31_00350 [candidate division WOR-3 bacterium]